MVRTILCLLQNLLTSFSPPFPLPLPFSLDIGHLGDVTVEHVAHHLPIIVRDFLREANEATHAGNYTPESISDLFTKAIMAFDDAIAHDVLDLFGGSVDNLDNYTDDEIREIINDQYEGGENWRKARLCMYGTTALVSLVDPDHKNLWVANLGDCQASEFSRILLVYFCPAHMSISTTRVFVVVMLRCDRNHFADSWRLLGAYFFFFFSSSRFSRTGCERLEN